ncbi:MAG: endolytic transglycosylase MltG [Bryobacteraceae bacterium]
MTDTFRRVWKEAGGSGDVIDRHVSVFGGEGNRVPEERPTVASVYENRLRIGMKLDCDPTTIYAAMLQGRYRGTIFRSDLDSLHPYNTYRVAGLPPGAIANPGKASLQAAIAPAETEYLYFVARPGGLGSHSFSETLGKHNVAVQAYRSGRTP